MEKSTRQAQRVTGWQRQIQGFKASCGTSRDELQAWLCYRGNPTGCDTQPSKQNWTKESSDRSWHSPITSQQWVLMVGHSDTVLRIATVPFQNTSSIQLDALTIQYSFWGIFFWNDFYKLTCAVANFRSFQLLMFMFCGNSKQTKEAIVLCNWSTQHSIPEGWAFHSFILG